MIFDSDDDLDILLMLKFNPSNYLTFTPNSQGKLQTSFVISNPSNNCSAPFKIKSTKPQLFNVRPHIGVINPLQQVQITIVTEQTNTVTFAKEIAHQHKFKVEYSMLDRAPSNINDALLKITDQNKQVHKFYLNTLTPKGQKSNEDYLDSKSNLSNRYKQAKDDDEEQQSLNRYTLQHGKYEEMSNEQKLEYLKQEIDKVEKEKSQVIMASKPNKRHINFVVLLLIVIFMLVVGNLTGKLIGLKPTPARNKKQREYKYFGLERIWAGQQKHVQQEKSWWKFWN